MRYIRFLKPPKIEGKSIKAVITITSDLGESFLAEDVALSANLLSGEDLARIYLRSALKWIAGMRALQVAMDISRANVKWPARLQVGVQNSTLSDSFGGDNEVANLPRILSAWSDIIHPARGISEAKKLVERRFSLLSKRPLKIWEETGESIARHIWDAGVTLTAYIDRIVVLQAGGLPLLKETLDSAASRGLNVLELGSGCGIVGIGLSQTVQNSKVLLTDLPEAEEIVRRNVSSNNPTGSSKVAFQAVDWEDPLPVALRETSFDIVLVADCTYNPDSSPALVRTLAAIIARSPEAIVVIAMKVRHSSEAVFFDLMAEAGFVVHNSTTLTLPTSDSEEEESVDVYVFGDKALHESRK